MDAELGFLTSSARIHVPNAEELKVRLGELAWLTKLAPEERQRVQREAAAWDLLIADIQRRHQPAAAQQSPDWGTIIDLCRKALRLRPYSIQVREVLQNAELRRQQKTWADARVAEQQKQTAALLAWQRQQQALLRAADEASLRKEQRAADDLERRRAQRETAAASLAARASWHLSRIVSGLPSNFMKVPRICIPTMPPSENWPGPASKPRKGRRRTPPRRQRLMRRPCASSAKPSWRACATQLDDERRQRANEELAARRAAEERDRRQYQRLLDQAQQFAAKQQYDRAVTAAQAAKQIRPTPEAERLTTELLVELRAPMPRSAGQPRKPSWSVN